ncbi:MAG: metal ABC transporter permease [Eubacteriales bacterium]|nr:metal ABC transporter permease [Eubacteriales bacterium]
MTEVYVILVTAAVACSIPGVFLVLRRLSMMADAISHSVLLGIVLAFFLVRDLHSPWLIVGASVFGLLTTAAIEALIKSRRVTAEAAVGMVFPLFFSVAVILISRYARDVHIDTDVVLMGEVVLAPFHRMELLGFSLPKALVQLSVVLLLAVVFVWLYRRALAVSSFDPVFATVIGIKTTVLYYLFMGLVSMISVTAFESIGAILTISFFVAPAASAYLVSKRLKYTLLFSVIYAIVNSSIGFALALYFNLSMAGMCAAVSGLTFLLTVLGCPQGIVAGLWRRRRKRRCFEAELLMLHMGNHAGRLDMLSELGVASIRRHVDWPQRKLDMVVRRLMRRGYVYVANEQGVFGLTQTGRLLLTDIRQEYGLAERAAEQWEDEASEMKLDSGKDEYIQAIFECMEAGGTVTNKRLAMMLDVKAASVSEMIRRLVESGDVCLNGKEIRLSDRGMARGRQLLTKHRLWEIFLVERLGYSWEEVDEAAKRLEHVTDDRLKDRLNRFLQEPKHCPHGNEIFENHIQTDEVVRLDTVAVGAGGNLHRVVDDRQLLAYLDDRGLAINDLITVSGRDEFDGSLRLESGGRELYIAKSAAERMWIIGGLTGADSGAN